VCATDRKELQDDIKAWATPDHLIGVLNQGETLPDTKIDIVYPPILLTKIQGVKETLWDEHWMIR
jgi:hypothetical protein